jgi:hypothetical protein
MMLSTFLVSMLCYLCTTVYSFAVVMWEVLTWRQPYETMMSVQVGLIPASCLQPVGLAEAVTYTTTMYRVEHR